MEIQKAFDDTIKKMIYDELCNKYNKMSWYEDEEFYYYYSSIDIEDWELTISVFSDDTYHTQRNTVSFYYISDLMFCVEDVNNLYDKIKEKIEQRFSLKHIYERLKQL